jgi:hypothetical protein
MKPVANTGTESGQLDPGLILLIRRNAYVRQPNARRRRTEGTKCKKGWEVRIVLKDEADIDFAHGLLNRSGVKAGRPFAKHRRWVIPVYGRAMVELIKKHTGLRQKRRKQKRT